MPLADLFPADPRQVGPFRLIGRLGHGGMGQVYLGRSPGGRLVAVKVIRPELTDNSDFRARFAREVAAARQVSGMFTAPVVAADIDGPVPYLVTAYVEGPSLEQAVTTRGPLPAEEVLDLAAGLAEGIAAIHAAEVVHRDLKPSNVILAQDGPRVIDFGISRGVNDTPLTRTGSFIGSLGFVSPEQATGAEAGPPSDIFSLGAVLVYAATGKGPFGEGQTAAMLYRIAHGEVDLSGLSGLSGSLLPLITKCLARDPRDRPSAAQLLTDLDAIRTGPVVIAPAFEPPAFGPPAFGPPADFEPPAASTGAPTVTSVVTPLPTSIPPAAATGAVAGPGDPAMPAPAGPAMPAPAGPAMPAPAGPATPLPGDIPPRAARQARPPRPPRPPREPGTGRGPRRGLVAVVAAVVAVLAVAGGLLAWSPWSSAKLSPPAGLSAVAAADSVTLHWLAPTAGPSPSGYLVLVNGRQAGTAPGSALSYQVGSLSPLTSYTFQVAASSGGDSARSGKVTIRTLAPPVADGRLAGSWHGQYKIVKMQGFDSSAKPGVTMTGTWTFTPACPAGACDVTMTGKIGADPFTAHLTRSGAVYTGTATASHTNCKGTPETDTLQFRVTVTGSGMVQSIWTAQLWDGTMTLLAPTTKACHSGSYQTTFTGTHP